MYTTMLAFSYSLHPATSTPTGSSRATKAIVLFALGAIAGWPFSALLAVPFVLEQLFMCGDDTASGSAKSQLLAKRWATVGKAAAIGACLAVSPTPCSCVTLYPSTA
jgi:alpha-1,2-mannosyltransferase